MIPQWMLDTSRTNHNEAAVINRSGRRVTGFAEKTIHEIFRLLQNVFFSERFAHSAGLLQKVDPRTKLLLSLVLLLTVSFLHSHVLLAVIYTLVLLLALVSHIGLWFFMKRVWLFVPLYTAIIALPATLNWTTPGDSVWILHRFERDFRIGPLTFPPILAITDNGLKAASLFVLRVATSVSLVVLLVLTTPWQKLLRALRILGVPQFLVFALGMTYRYIHLLLNLMLDLQFGKKSRTLRAVRWSQDQNWVASQLGYLFKRSQNLGESVYGAMLSRGFRGEPRILDELHWGRADLIATAIVAVLCIVTLLAQKPI